MGKHAEQYFLLLGKHWKVKLKTAIYWHPDILRTICQILFVHFLLPLSPSSGGMQRLDSIFC